MNYLLQRKDMPTRYFKILLLFREIVRQAKQKLSSHVTAAVCELNL